MIDALLVFDGTFNPSAGVAITASRASTNILDMLVFRDIGTGDDLELHVQIMQNFATLTSLQIAYQTSPDATAGNFVDIMLSPVILLTNLTVGAPIFRYKVPPYQRNDTGVPNRFHRLNYTVGGSNATAGSVIAYLTGGGDRPSVTTYPNNYSQQA